MNKLLFTALFIIICANSHAQVFGTAQTLAKNTGNIGIMPTIFDYDGDNDFMMFLQGGYGLTKGIDLGVKIGILGDENYFGADVEFHSKKNFSIAGGIHSYVDFGLDLTGLYTFNLNNKARLTTGLDMDIVFSDPNTLVPLWIPLNLEVDIKKDLVFMLEAGIDTKLFDESYHIMSGGFQYYF